MRGEKANKANKIIEELNLDAVLLVNYEYPRVDPNFIYFLQPKSGLFEGSFLVIEKDKTTLFTRELEAPAAKNLGVDVKTIKEKEDIFRYLKKFRRIGINGKVINFRTVKKLESLGILLVDVSEELEELREVKSEEEIEKIKKAVEISEKALKKVVDEGLDRREVEIAADLEYYIKKFGGQGLAFETIVAHDENSAIPHYKTGSNDKIPERVVLIDFGAKYENYCCDITRTFILKKDNEVIEAYNTVLEAQRRAIEKIREGEIAENLDKAAREIIEKKYPGKFIHSLGHMFGIEVHEGKVLRGKWKLKEKMVFTVEPGVYLEGRFGIRIEDDIVVRKNCAEILTKFPKELDGICLY